jgi:hypothetical protein
MLKRVDVIDRVTAKMEAEYHPEAVLLEYAIIGNPDDLKAALIEFYKEFGHERMVAFGHAIRRLQETAILSVDEIIKG